MTDEITLDAPETRLERFLAAAAGMDGITLDEPVTRIEKYLYMIAQGSGGVPAVEDADKGKYLHANESTGDLEWATAGGGGTGGGVLVVHSTNDYTTLDKTWQEIHDAALNGIVVLSEESGSQLLAQYLHEVVISGDEYQVGFGDTYYIASSADGYPIVDLG